MLAHRAHPREPAHPGAADQPHEQGLGLVLGMVGGKQHVEAPGRRPVAEHLIAPRPAQLLDRGRRRLLPRDGQHLVRNAKLLAQSRDRIGLVAAALAQVVIDGGGLDLARTRSGGEQQQGEAVGAAGHGKADGLVVRGDRRQRARKAFERLLRRLETAFLALAAFGLLQLLHCACCLASIWSFLRSGRILAP